MKCVGPVKILKYRDKMQYEMEDNVVIEYELLLCINGYEFIRFICTPEKMEELAIGHLYSENIIKDYDCIENIQFDPIDEEKGKINLDIHNPDPYIYTEKGLFCVRTITTACGNNRSVPIPIVDNYHVFTSQPQPDYEKMNPIMRIFNGKSQLFMDTGGVHSCGITDFQMEDILFFAEDIGRHNALDKVIGLMVKEKVDFKDKILLTSGRVSSEIVFKALSAKIGVLVSRSAPTSKALTIAKKYNMMIIGFARGNRFNVYTGRSSLNL